MAFVRLHGMDAVGNPDEHGLEAAARQVLGVSSGAFTNWKSRGISMQGALLAQKKFGCSANWVLNGVGEQISSDAVNTSSNVEPGPDVKGVYPLISFVQAGKWSHICDNFQPGEAEEWIMSSKNLGKHGYVLRVKGASMTAPEGAPFTFPEGVLLHVRPDANAYPGRFVIARRSNEDEATFKRLALIDGQRFLEALNPDWPNRFLKMQDGDEIIGVVVDASYGNLP